VNLTDLKNYARLGAADRLAEIETERAAILAAFPALRATATDRARQQPAKQKHDAPPRRRRRLSKEAKRRISEAQKKRWAAQKAKG
jgi:hypothetical protein